MRMLLVIFLSMILGFVLGSRENDTSIVKDLRTELQLLRTELAKKTGIVVTPTTSIADEALSKAESLIQRGQLAHAALYFNNAWANQPRFDTLQRYQQKMLDYCRQLVEKGELEVVLQILSDLDNFSRTQVVYLSVSEIEKLQQLLAEIDTFRQTVETTLVSKQPNEIKSEIATRSPPQEGLQSQEELTKLVKRVELFLTLAVNEPVNSELTLYYLTSAQSILQQLVLLEPEINGLKAKVVTLSDAFEKTKKTISQNQSKAVWEEINQGLQTIVVDNKGKAEQAIQQLVKQRQFLAEQVSKLTDSQFLNQAHEVLEKINDELASWQTKQQRLYDRWAISRVKLFYDQVQLHLGNVKNDKEGIAKEILTYLSDIDTRYLSLAVNTAYNEVFALFYAKLDDEAKMSLSAEIALAKKKKLTDF